jgi:hypothetical protein
MSASAVAVGVGKNHVFTTPTIKSENISMQAVNLQKRGYLVIIENEYRLIYY